MSKLWYLLVRFVTNLSPSAIKNSHIHKKSIIGAGSQIVNLHMDKYSYTGRGCLIVNAKVGAFCSIADNVVIGAMAHPIDYVSTSPLFHAGGNIFRKTFSEHPAPIAKSVTIGHDVWIGHSAHISAGVEIGNGAVIAQGAVVTKDVPSYSIVAGVPAKFIKQRFPNEISVALNKSQWWLYDDADLSIMAKYFSDPVLFSSKCKDGL